MASERRFLSPVWHTGILAGALLAGCHRGPIGLTAPGEFEKVRLGKPLPADLARHGRRDGLGLALHRTARKALSGESRREILRAVLDGEGKVVAVHCLRTWRRRTLSGAEEEKHRFILEARVAAPPGPASRPADGAALDETLLAMARASALGSGPRVRVPAAWDRVAESLLRQLNERRKARGLPPARRPAEAPAELLLVAEMLLESVATDDAAPMARIVWEELDLAGALRRVPRTWPTADQAPQTWQRRETRDGKGWTLTLGVPFLVHLPDDRHRSSGSLSHFGAGHVRIVLQSEWWKGLAQ
ncbi:MAG TPA: hypothetical protein VM031_03655 [Phycisphaerae bacterium]|nr:hypothetical protein [Phycisphaerae bacterium]